MDNSQHVQRERENKIKFCLTCDLRSMIFFDEIAKLFPNSYLRDLQQGTTAFPCPFDLLKRK